MQEGYLIVRDQRTNRRIRAREVRVVGAQGEQLGVLTLEAALAHAAQEGLDLVEVNPMAKPPVCKIMDYGRFKYEEKKKANETKKKQVVVKVKEIKLRPKTEEHDYEFKVRNVRSFVEEGNKAKVTIMFRGREITHRDRGQAVLDEVAKDLADIAVLETPPRMEGRQMFMILAPNPKIAQKARDMQRQHVAALEKAKREQKRPREKADVEFSAKNSEVDEVFVEDSKVESEVAAGS
ncbi:MAG: translation initiation factor IF-3 [Proteobacteria bacterium]|nr:translation initiation factor IF-3 [Cystobacterineae bacterium]MCL2314363.1 translation initiation factor IF-3 [Pseudomonadota bacterium]